MNTHPCPVMTMISERIGSAKREQTRHSQQLCLQQGLLVPECERARARSWHQKANELTIVCASPENMQFDLEYLDGRKFCSVSFGLLPRFPSKVYDDISSSEWL